MEYAKRGAEVLSSDPAAAIVEYTKALIEHPTSPDYYTQRSIAFTRLKTPKHALALQDAEAAVLCGQKRGKRDKIQAGQQRRVVALYNLGRYADAKLILDSMNKWRPKESKPQQMEHAMWDSKISKKLSPDSTAATVTEYPSDALSSDAALVKKLKSQLTSDGSFIFNAEDVSKQDCTVQPTSSTQPVPKEADTQASATSAPVALQNIRHEWYQNNNNVIITIYAKGVPKDKAEVELLEDSISVAFPHPSDPSRSFTFSLDPLFALITPSSSKYSVMSTKIELTLAKVLQGQKWPNLEGTEPLAKTNKSTADQKPLAQGRPALQQPQTSEKGPAYPTSSKSGPKNWDKVADDLTAKPKKAKTKSDETKESKSDDDSDAGYESDYGGDAVDGFFKKLYAGADPDTRRAMMKSFQESNGTALSTNWSDVGARRVDEVKSKNDD